MSKGSNPTQTSTSSSSVDPGTAAFIQEYRKRALGLMNGQPGDDSLRRGFVDNINYAMGSDPLQGLDQFLNPYQSNVIDATNADFERQRKVAGNAADAEATAAGAFGGDRAAVLKANNQANIDQSQASTIAGLRSGGYNNAVQQLLASKAYAGQMGMQGLFGMNQQQLAALQGLIPGFTPTSQNSSQTQVTQTNNDPFSQLLGLGLGLAGPIGGIVNGIFNQKKK